MGGSDLAFIRLLAEAKEGGQARVDALLALSQRTLFVPTWIPGDEAFRTVVNSGGVGALPVFATLGSAEELSHRFGWATPDGRVPIREVGARAVLGHALAQNLLVLVEMGKEHSIEIDVEEIRPLLHPSNRRDPSGAFSVSGKTTSAVTEAVAARDARRASSRPPSADRISSVPNEVGIASRTSNPTLIAVTALSLNPTDALLDALSEVLRAYPEVEWACLAMVSEGNAPAQPATLLRVDGSYRSRLPEIHDALHRESEKFQAGLQIVLADDPAVMKAARQLGKPYYPWRK